MQLRKINNASYSDDLFVSFAVHFEKNETYNVVFVKTSNK